MLQFGLRLGGNPRCLVATTPRPTKLIRELLAREGRDVAVTRGSTYENRANLAPGFIQQGAALQLAGQAAAIPEILVQPPASLRPRHRAHRRRWP